MKHTNLHYVVDQFGLMHAVKNIKDIQRVAKDNRID